MISAEIICGSNSKLLVSRWKSDPQTFAELEPISGVRTCLRWNRPIITLLRVGDRMSQKFLPLRAERSSTSLYAE